MMRNTVLFLLAVFVFSSLAFANGDGSELSTFFNETSERISSETSDWVSSQTGSISGVQTVFTSVLGAFGPGQCGDSWINAQGAGTIIGMWLAPSVIIIMIVFIGIAIVYMLGQFMGSPNLIALAKDETFQAAVTIARVLVIIAVLTSGEMWFDIITTGASDDIYTNSANTSMMDGAMQFSRMMVAQMINHYSLLLMYNMVIHTIFSSTMWFGVTWRAMYSFNLGPVLKPLIDIIGTALQFLSLGISEWMLHIVTLCIIKRWAWGLFIPLGMLLRSFPYTRNGGEALLALTFALVIIYPFMFLFDYEVHKVMQGNLVDASSAVSSFIHKSGILAVFGSVLIIMFLMAGVFMPFFLGGALTLAFELIRGAVYYIVIMSLLLPFLNIFVTLTAAKESAAFFKVDVNFMSFLKII
jgi:hypothetical protein